MSYSKFFLWLTAKSCGEEEEEGDDEGGGDEEGGNEDPAAALNVCTHCLIVLIHPALTILYASRFAKSLLELSTDFCAQNSLNMNNPLTHIYNSASSVE